MSSFKKYVAEFFGTFVLVLLGCGTACAVGVRYDAGAGYLLTALAFGLVIVAMAYSIGNISGCHINPAVSLAMLLTKQMSFKEFIGYVAAQNLGSIAAAIVLSFLFGADTGLGANGLFNGNILSSLVVEILLTFVFVLAILGVTSKVENKSVSGIVIGLTLALVHILGIALTGTSVNPARSFGPALLAGGEALACVWVFLLAPMVGSFLAVLLYKYLTNDKPRVKKEKKAKKAKKSKKGEAEVAETEAVEAPAEIAEEIVEAPVEEAAEVVEAPAEVAEVAEEVVEAPVEE